jgi:hypothetical protein
MQTKLTRVDINRTKAAWPDTEFNPAFVASRGSGTQKWLVADSAIVQNEQIAWALAANDEYIRIPLFQYTLPAQGDSSLAFAFKLGLICATQLDRRIEHLHVVTGNPVELITDTAGNVTGMQYWLGVAVAFE